MAGPKKRNPRSPVGHQKIHEFQVYQQSFDPEAFDHQIQSHGVRFKHMKAVPDPSGKTSRGDMIAVNKPNSANSDGFIYVEAGIVVATMSSNSSNTSIEEIGTFDHAVCYITMARNYEDNGEVIMVNEHDKFEPCDVELKVVGTQLLESSPTGVDRLNFPAYCIEYVIGSDGKQYKQGVDFELTSDGYVKWLNQNRPAWDETREIGQVIGVRYRYLAYFIVNRLIHEIRLALVTDPRTQKREVIRMPYQVELARENIFKDLNRSKETIGTSDPRFNNAPSVGGNLGSK